MGNALKRHPDFHPTTQGPRLELTWFPFIRFLYSLLVPSGPLKFDDQRLSASWSIPSENSEQEN
jgi:hypothetical protein